MNARVDVIDHIYRDGRHYDRLFPGPGEDISFWLRLAQQRGSPILELTCGTGRLTIPMAEAGYAMTGLDGSPAMLDEARRKAAAAGVQVRWVEADMCDFYLSDRYSLILLPANALCHLLTLADFEACLACIKRHLAPGGKFVVDVFVPKMELLVETHGERGPFSEYDDPDGRGSVVVTESYVYEPDTQIKRITTYQAVPGEEERVGKLDLRMYFPQELEALLKYNGFQIVEKYGAYDQTPFTATSEKQLIVSRTQGGECRE